jgi:hypothetical protein
VSKIIFLPKGLPRSWLCGGWMYNCLCSQYLSQWKVLSSNSAHGEVYSIQHYVLKFVSGLRQICGFLRLINLQPTFSKHRFLKPIGFFLICIVFKLNITMHELSWFSNIQNPQKCAANNTAISEREKKIISFLFLHQVYSRYMYIYIYMHVLMIVRIRRGRDRVVVEFTTICAMSAYHH